MNKSVNMLLFLLFIPTMAFTLWVGFDFPLEMFRISGSQIPVRKEIFLGLAILFLLIGTRRSLKRWMGVRMVNQLDKYRWNTQMAPSRYRHASLYLIIESVLHLLMGMAVFIVSHEAWSISLVLALLGIDHLLFALLANYNKWYRVGVTSKAILVADRDVKAIYFSGLRKISVQQQSLFFDYPDEFQMDFPVDCVSPSDRQKFREVLDEVVNRDRVHFTESFKNF